MLTLTQSAATPATRVISEKEKPFLIAEVGLNHNRDIVLAKKMVDAAREVGIDAIKLQSYTTRLFINRQFENVHALYDIFSGLELDLDFHRTLRDYTVAAGLTFFSTPLTEDWVFHLADLGVSVLKIASGDLNNWPLLKAATKTTIPLIVSTGAHDHDEVLHAVDFLRTQASSRFALMHCVSLYPTPKKKAHLARMARLQEIAPTQTPVGFSDHTEGSEAAFAAVAMGAQIIEKHFTLDKSLPGPDQKMSSNPEEMRHLREQIDLAWEIRGRAENCDCHEEEKAGDYFGKRSLYIFEGKETAMRPRHRDFPIPEL